MGFRILRSAAGRRRTRLAARASSLAREFPAARRKRRDSASKGEERRSSSATFRRVAYPRTGGCSGSKKRRLASRSSSRLVFHSRDLFCPFSSEREQEERARDAGVAGVEAGNERETVAARSPAVLRRRNGKSARSLEKSQSTPASRRRARREGCRARRVFSPQTPF